MEIKTHPITAFVCVRNGNTVPHLFKKTLESLEFCEQLIIVNDASFDGTIATAKEFTDEVYEWYGDDSMAERRNYAVGFKGNDRHTPEWISNERMKDNYPEVKNDWIVYLDSDEFIYQHEMMPDMHEELQRVFKDDECEAFQIYIYNITLDGEMMTSSPLMRIFRKGTVWWDGKIQHNIHHGNPVGSLKVAMMHFGYGDHNKQQHKFWNRLSSLQDDVRDKPEDAGRRRYLINNLSGLAMNERHQEECLAHFLKYKEIFENSPKKDDDEMLLQAATRHFWHTMMKTGKFGEFNLIIQDILKYIWWIPDVWQWKMTCAQQLEDLEDIIHCGYMYFRAVKYLKDSRRAIEVESMHEQYRIANGIIESLLALKKTDLVRKAFFREAELWNSKFKELLLPGDD